MTAPNKLFGIGLSRTGTTSLAVALLYLGFRTAHYIAGDGRTYEQAEALTDSPIFVDYPELDRRYPGSRFIYTARDPQRWVQSFRESLLDGHFRQRLEILNPQHPNGEMNRRVYLQLFGRVDDLTDDALLAGYHRHHEKVGEYFQSRPDDLLTMTVDEESPDELWSRLCEFVGRRLPGSFPSFRNRDARLWERIVHPCKVEG